MNYDVIGIGNALVDIQVQVDDAFIKELNITKGGMTLSDPQYQNEILDRLNEHNQKISSGGSAANTIHGLGVLGGKCYYLGRVANDAYGKHYTQDMTACGVGFLGPGAESGLTGTSVILITPDSQRTMITHLGVSAVLHPNNVDENIIRTSKIVYIEGYLWTGDETRAAAIKMADYAKKQGIPVAFSLSDAFVADGFKDSLIEYIQWNVDILFCNEIEAKTLTDEHKAQNAMTKLLGMTENVFITLGSEGSLAAQSEGKAFKVKPFPVDAIDTTGAGDLFAAGALYGLLKERSLKECGVIGSYCASQVVTQLGARMPVNAHTDVYKILEQYKSL